MKTNHKFGVRGIVTRKLYDKEGNPVKMFRENRFWEFLRNNFNLDIKVPFLTGTWTTEPIVHNDLTPAGFAAVASLIIGGTVPSFKYLALGTGTATSAGLESEITTSGGARAEATVTTEEIDEDDDTAQALYEWTCGGDLAITEEGWFNGSTSGSPGTMLAFRNFSTINVENGMKLEITHQVQVKEDSE